MNDTLTGQLVDTSIDVATAFNNTPNLIPNVPNTLLSALAMLIYGVIHRTIEKRKLRKKGLLVDKKINDSTK